MTHLLRIFVIGAILFLVPSTAHAVLLTLDVSGPGTGTIVSSPPGIDCGTDCSQDFPSGTIVTLTPIAADSDSSFVGWGGVDCPPLEPCTFTMQFAGTVTAVFDGPEEFPDSTDITAGKAAASDLKIYWTDLDAGTIQRANLDGSGMEDLITTGLVEPTAIALDVASGKMYWIDGLAAKIQWANLDGSGVEDLLTGLGVPRGIALDVAGGKMYWTDSGSPSKIQRANLDGSGVEDLVTLSSADPVDIALDVAGGKMYWTDTFAPDKIQRANLDGTGVEVLLTSAPCCFLGIAVDAAGGKIYWTGAGIEPASIQRGNLDGSGVEDLVTGLPGSPFPSGIALALDSPAPSPVAGDGQDITWDVIGVDLDLVICRNKTNGQKVRIDVSVPASGSCGDLGLAWGPGDDIQVKVVGTVNSVADAGGTVTGIDATLLVCKNKSTDPQEKARVEDPPSSWDWGDTGLPLAPGERVQWKANGSAN